MRNLAVLFLCPLVMTAEPSLRLVNGEVHEGKIELDSGGIKVTPASGATTKVLPASVWKAVFGERRDGSATYPTGVVLLNGTIIPGKPVWTETGVGLKDVAIPPDKIAWAVYRSDKPVVASSIRGRTGALLENGDFFAGTFAGTERHNAVLIHSSLFGAQRFSPGGNAVVVALAALQDTPALYEVATRDGALYRTDDIQIAPEAVQLRDAVVGAVSVARKDLIEIRAGNGRLIALVEQQPTLIVPPAGMEKEKALHVPSSDEAQAQGWPGDGSVLAVAANTTVSYPMPAGFSVFTCKLHPGKQAAPGARFSIVVAADGRLLSAPHMFAASASPQPFRISTSPCKTISFRVESSDPAGWIGLIEPILLRP